MKHSTETANNAVNGDNLRSNTFGRIEKALYGLVCCLSCMVILVASGGCDIGTPYAGGGIAGRALRRLPGRKMTSLFMKHDLPGAPRVPGRSRAYKKQSYFNGFQRLLE